MFALYITCDSLSDSPFVNYRALLIRIISDVDI